MGQRFGFFITNTSLRSVSFFGVVYLLIDIFISYLKYTNFDFNLVKMNLGASGNKEKPLSSEAQAGG